MNGVEQRYCTLWCDFYVSLCEPSGIWDLSYELLVISGPYVAPTVPLNALWVTRYEGR